MAETNLVLSSMILIVLVLLRSSDVYLTRKESIDLSGISCFKGIASWELMIFVSIIFNATNLKEFTSIIGSIK